MSLHLTGLDEEAIPDHEYHRRRAEVEMDKALTAGKPMLSLLHLELAQMHRQRRVEMVTDERRRLRAANGSRICRTDKES